MGTSCRIRPGLAAWLIFAAAAFAPAWILSDRLAAEVQLRHGLLFGRKDLRDLGPDGRQYLCEVLLNDRDPERRIGAAILARHHHGAETMRARILSIRDPNPAVPEMALSGYPWSESRLSARAAIDGITDDEYIDLLHRPADPDYRCWLLDALMRMERPERWERVMSRLLRTTSDLALGREATSCNWYNGTRFASSYGFDSPKVLEGWKRALAAGRENPNEGIQSLCAERLAEYDRWPNWK